MTNNEAIDARLSHVCSCGASKAQGRPFCFHCWTLLPYKLRERLNVYQGYAETITLCEASLTLQREQDEAILREDYAS
jgi:hypothetical protein